jgi:hypothetical protein
MRSIVNFEAHWSPKLRDSELQITDVLHSDKNRPFENSQMTNVIATQVR